MKPDLRSLLKRGIRLTSTSRLRMAGLRAAFASMTIDEQDRVRTQWQILSMDWSLRNLARAGFRPEAIIDVGAFQGDWTRSAKAAFPGARVLMVEAQHTMQPALESVAAELGNGVQYHIGLLGAVEGQIVPFFEHETGSTVMFERSSVARSVTERRLETLDHVAARLLPGIVDLLKLDVQGYELEVLKGSAAILERAEAVLMEVSLLPVNEGAPILSDVTEFMRHRGFVAYDICGLVRRPLDLALWQIDCLFVRADSRLRSILSYD